MGRGRGQHAHRFHHEDKETTMEKISSTRRPFMARALGAIAALPLV